MAIKRVLVIGGTGMLGQPVVERLAADGYEVTVGSRSAASVRRHFGDRFKIAEIDMSKPDSIAVALTDQDAVHLNLPSGPRFEDCFRNESDAMKNLAAVAKDSGVQRITYLSGENVRAESVFPPARAKWLAEESLRGCEVPYTIFRATWFMETLGNLIKFGVAIQPGKGKTSVYWLAGRDLGSYVAKSLDCDGAANKVLYAVGPQKHSLHQALKTYRDICHPRYHIITFPLAMMTTMGKVMRKWDMWFGAQMMKYLESETEAGDPKEAVDLLGRTTTTLEEFARSKSKTHG